MSYLKIVNSTHDSGREPTPGPDPVHRGARDPRPMCVLVAKPRQGFCTPLSRENAAEGRRRLRSVA